MRRTSFLRVALLSATTGVGFLTLSAHAQNTVPVGFLKLTLPATTSTELRTTLNFPLANPATFSGPVASFTANTVTVSGTPFSPGALVSTPSFVRFLSGTQAGRTIRITANTANTLTLDTTDNSAQTVALDGAGFSLAAADRFEILPANTIGSVFGGIPGKTLALVGGATEEAADAVSLYNPATLAWEFYFYNSALTRWVKSGSTADASATVIQPDESTLIVRRANRDAVELVTLGSVPSVAPRTKVISNQAKYSSTRFPIPVTLSQLDFGADWVRGTSPFKADTLALWNDATQKWDSYYRLPAGTWRKAGDSATDQSNLSIPAGTVVGLLKRTAPSTTASFVSAPLPYSL